MASRLWIGGRVQAPIYLTDPEPRRPDFVVWIDTVSGKIVDGEIAESTESVEKLVECLSRVIQEPKGPLPDRIRVADAALAEAVRGVVGHRTAVEIAPTPEVAQVAETMLDFFSSQTDGPDAEAASYFEDGRVAPATVARFFDAAAELYRAAPWNELWDADVLGLDIPQYGLIRAALSVIGRAGQNYGFVIFDSASAHGAFCAVGRDPMGGGRDLGASTLSLNFESKARIPASMLREIKLHRWRVAGPKAHPFVMAVDRDRVQRPLREREVRIVCAVAESLARFVAKHRPHLSSALSGPIVEECAITIDEDRLNVRLTAPHPEVPWLPDEDDSSEAGEMLDWNEDDEDDEDEDDEEDFQKIVDAFVDAQKKTKRRQASWLDAAGFIAGSFLHYKKDYSQAPDHVSKSDAEQYLLDYFPRKVTADDAMIELAPEILVAFYEWLAARGAVPPEVSAAVRARVAAIRERFLAAARDPARFGPAKSFMMQMHAEGVDMTDDVAVQEAMLRYNARLGTETRQGSRDSFLSIPDDRAPEPTFKLSPRWIPEPGATPPSAKAPCPCGSGRVYGKCCRPR